MSMPITRNQIWETLVPHLGACFQKDSPLMDRLVPILREYAPYRTPLRDLQRELYRCLWEELLPEGAQDVEIPLPDGGSRTLSEGELPDLTDDLMALVFDEMVPFEANFVKINDYSMQEYGIAALRTLYQRYASFYSPEEMDFLIQRIRSLYPPESYEQWLKP